MSNDKIREALESYEKAFEELFVEPSSDITLMKEAHVLAMDALSASEGAAPVVVPEGFALVPDFRGYAHLGTGQYLINHSAAGHPAELVITVATEDEKAGRTVGDEGTNVPGELIQPDAMAVRIRFENAAGLAALQKQLDYLRDTHFPQEVTTPQPAATAADERHIEDAQHWAPRPAVDGAESVECDTDDEFRWPNAETPPATHAVLSDDDIDHEIRGDYIGDASDFGGEARVVMLAEVRRIVRRFAAQPAVNGAEPDIADIIAGALQTSRAHAYELMRYALAAVNGAGLSDAAYRLRWPIVRLKAALKAERPQEEIDHRDVKSLLGAFESSAAPDTQARPVADAEPSVGDDVYEQLSDMIAPHVTDAPGGLPGSVIGAFAVLLDHWKVSRQQTAPDAQARPAAAPHDFESQRAQDLARAWAEGWANHRDSDYSGSAAQNEAFNRSETLSACLSIEHAPTAPPADDCDVRRILIDVVPGEDGMGREVYARSNKDVVEMLTVMDQRIEDLQSTARPAAPLSEPAEAVTELRKALNDAATSLETISRLAGRSHYVLGDERVETYMGHFDEVRAYASARAGQARAAIAATSAGEGAK